MSGKWIIIGRGIFFAAVFTAVLSASAWAQNRSVEKDALLRASRIIDGDLYNVEGEQIGEIDDLVVRRSGRVKKVTFEFGGFMDIGDKLAAAPFNRMRFRKNGGMIVDMPAEILRGLSEYDYIREGLQPGYFYWLNRFRGVQPYPPPGYYYHGRYYPPPSRPGETPDDPYKWAYSPDRFLASAVMDRNLINERGVGLGDLTDLLIDRNGTVDRILVSIEDLTGKEDVISLPYEPLGFTGHGLVYEITRQEIRQRPVFNRK